MTGLDVKEPESECEDPNCPFHGSLSVRGKILEGEVVSTKMDKTVVVENEYYKFVPKFERYEVRNSKIPAHHPGCIDVDVGDRVKIAETRPLSKTKRYVVVEGGG